MADKVEPGSTNHWADDALARHEFADFLHPALVALSERMEASEGGGATVCIDGEWGTGKSFFLKGFAEYLRSKNHCVAFFDAWTNDLGDGTAAPLMAEVDSALRKVNEIRNAGEKGKAEVNALLQETAVRFRKSVLPISKLVATGLIRRYVGVAVDEVMGLFGEPKEDAGAGANLTDEVLDKWMQHMLTSHGERVEAISAFRQKLGETLQALAKDSKIRPPMFLLVDELDRCRPSYAISLLEEMKHLFRVPGVCFVVCTNLTQLQESVRVVYGSTFEGRRYLERFFDRRYALPEDLAGDFSGVALNSDQSVWATRSTIIGMPPQRDGSSVEEAFKLISFALDLEFRAQKRLAAIAADVAAGLPKDDPLHCLWLFFLCGVWIRNPALFRDLDVDTSALTAGVVSKALKNDVALTWYSPAEFPGREPKKNSTQLSAVLQHYVEAQHRTLEELRARSSKINMYDYPNSLIHSFAQELDGSPSRSRSSRSSVSRYPRLVRFAGTRPSGE